MKKQDSFPDPETEYIQTKISLRNLAKKWDTPFTTIAKQSKRGNWINRRKQFWHKRNTKIEETAIQSIAEMNAEHLRMLHGMLGYNLQDVKNLNNKSRGEATRAAIESIKQIRVIREQPSDVVSHIGGININLRCKKT
jgi:hypothetical protein